MTEIRREELAKHALRELARQHPELSLQQLAMAMRDAEWDWDANPVTVKIHLPIPLIDVKLEINLAKTQD
jgi:hypothetical protein